MIHDHMNIWLLRPGVRGFSNLPTLLDDTDKRGGAEQFGEHWRPIEGNWGFRCYGRDSNSKLWNGNQSFELLGAIRLPNELVMIFEDGFVAIVQSDRTFEVARIAFEVSWISPVAARNSDLRGSASIEPPDDPRQPRRSKAKFSYKPEVFFAKDWHGSGSRFAFWEDAKAFVKNLKETWIPPGFIKDTRVRRVEEPPNVFLDQNTKQAVPFTERDEADTLDSDGRAA